MKELKGDAGQSREMKANDMKEKEGTLMELKGT